MKILRVHFDGRVLVPDEPVDLPVGEPLLLRVRRRQEGNAQAPPSGGAGEEARRHAGGTRGSSNVPTNRPESENGNPSDDRPLLRLAALLGQLPDNPDMPTDAAAQHDHYLYGTPKQE